MSDMGTFRTTIQIASHHMPSELRDLPDTLVDTGSELTWVPRELLESLGVRAQKTLRFRVADGRTLERQVGYAIIHAVGTQTTDEVTFAEPGDMILLGARAMEGLNLRVEPRLKRLVDAGPVDAGLCTIHSAGSATFGSTSAARYAGMKLAAIATKSMTLATLP